MSRAIFRRITLIILALSLWMPSLSLAEFPLPIQLLAGNTADPVRVLLSEPEVKLAAQFDETRTEQLNRLIRHLSLELKTDGDCGETAVQVDLKPAFSFLQKEEGKEVQRIYSFDPAVLYAETTPENDEAYHDDFLTFLEENLMTANQFADSFYDFFASTREAFSDRLRTEKTDLRFSGFGKAVQRVTISFPADYVAEQFPAALAGVAQDDRCKQVLSSLVYSGSQKIGLLYDENDRIVRITYDGAVGQSEDALRKVSLVWKCLRDTNVLKDSITLKTPALAGADKDNILMERDLNITDPEAGRYVWNYEADHRAGKEDRKKTSFSAELISAGTALNGSLAYNVKRAGLDYRLKISPELQQENTGEYAGTLEIADYSGKIEKNRAVIGVRLSKGDALHWPSSGVTKVTLPSSGAGSAQQSSVRDSLEDRMISLLIQKVFELPEEDLIYFSTEIPPTEWAELFH